MSDTKVAHPGVEPLSRCGPVGPLFAFEWGPFEDFMLAGPVQFSLAANRYEAYHWA